MLYIRSCISSCLSSPLSDSSIFLMRSPLLLPASVLKLLLLAAALGLAAFLFTTPTFLAFASLAIKTPEASSAPRRLRRARHPARLVVDEPQIYYYQQEYEPLLVIAEQRDGPADLDCAQAHRVEERGNERRVAAAARDHASEGGRAHADRAALAGGDHEEPPGQFVRAERHEHRRAGYQREDEVHRHRDEGNAHAVVHHVEEQQVVGRRGGQRGEGVARRGQYLFQDDCPVQHCRPPRTHLRNPRQTLWFLSQANRKPERCCLWTCRSSQCSSRRQRTPSTRAGCSVALSAAAVPGASCSAGCSIASCSRRPWRRRQRQRNCPRWCMGSRRSC